MSPKNDISPFLSSADQRWLKYGKAAPQIIAVLEYLLDLNLNFKNPNAIFFGRVWTNISQKELASIIQHPITTMQRSIQRLKNDGFIYVFKLYEGSLNNVTYYSLNYSKYQNIRTEERYILLEEIKSGFKEAGFQPFSTEESHILLEEIKSVFKEVGLQPW